MATATKIYIDPTEDIVFAFGKIENAPANKVILITPHGSNITSSQVSMKLLVRMLNSSQKLVVLVTEDDLARRNAEKAGMVSAEKVSEVEMEHWHKADEARKKLQQVQDQKQAELVSQIKDDDFELVDDDTSDGKVDVQLDGAQVEDRISTSDSASAASEEEVKPFFHKLEPKVIDLDDYVILSGGDVVADDQAVEIREKLLEVKKAQTPEPVMQEPSVSEGPEISSVPSFRKMQEEPKPEKVEKPEKQDKEIVSDKTAQENDTQETSEKPVKKESTVLTNGAYMFTQGYTNVNFAKGYDRLSKRSETGARGTVTRGGGNIGDKASATFASVKEKLPGVLNAESLSGIRNFLLFYIEKFKSLPTRMKVAVVVVPLLLIVIFMMLFSSPKAEVTVTVAKQSIPISEKVTAADNVSVVDIEALQIPLRYVTKTDSRSETGSATGKGESGTKATGKVKIFNFNSNDITLKSGTKLTSVNNSLDYVLKQTVTIKALSEYDTEVPIEAAKFGEEYNLSSGKKDFTVGTKDVSVFSVSGVSGGEKKEVTTVSQSDIDGLKGELTNVLKSALENDLNNLISDSEIRLSDSVTYGDPQVTTTKNANDEAEFFDITVSMEAKVAVVEKKYLEELVLGLVKDSSSITGDLKVEELASPEITNVEVKDNKISFNIDASADVTPDLNEDDLKSQIKGKGLGDAKNTLSSDENVKNVEVNFSPGYLPGFLKKIPQDDKNLEFTILKSAE